MQKTFLVTGATGRQGGAAARELVKQGAKVHALVRDQTSKASRELSDVGVKLFEGDFMDKAAIQAAIEGASGVFLNTIPNFTAYPVIDSAEGEGQQARNIIEAASRAGTVSTIVASTVLGTENHHRWLAEDPSYVLAFNYGSKSLVEELVRRSGLEHYTILRPAWLMHNYLPPHSDFHYPELASEDTLVAPYGPGLRLAHFDAYDVGKYAAAALLHPERYGGKELALGNEELTLAEAATKLSRALGREIKYRHLSRSEVANFGSSPPLHYIWGLWANKKGFSADKEILAEYGIPLSTFDAFLKREVDIPDKAS